MEGGFFQFRDLVLELQFAPLERGQDEGVGSRVPLGVRDFSLEVAMTALKFGKLRFGGHQHSASVSAYDDDSRRGKYATGVGLSRPERPGPSHVLDSIGVAETNRQPLRLESWERLVNDGSLRLKLGPLGASETGLLGDDRRLNQEEEREVQRELAELRQEHRDLDDAIAALASAPVADTMGMQRLKKRKLALKDRIAKLEDRLLPDIIA